MEYVSNLLKHSISKKQIFFKLSQYFFNKTLVIGIGLIGGSFAKALRKHNLSKEIYASSNEWDFYTDVFNCTNIDFFLYTPEIAYSMMPDEYTKWNLYKQKLYGIEYRNKMKAIYSEKARNIIHRIIVSTGTKRTSVIWTKSQFFDIFKEYKINHRRYL